MKRKVIGIPGYKDAKAESFGAGINYLDFIDHFADARIIMPYEKHVKVDMLLLPGGLDTQPARYGEVPGFHTSNQDVFKEFFFENRLHLYVNRGTPIFGICLGLQELAVYFGCKLTQDLITHPSSTERWKTAHTVFPYKKDTPIIINGKEHTSFQVNSHHHQALCEKGLNKLIDPIYKASNDDKVLTKDGDIIEAFVVKNHSIVAVQWHPEELYDKFSIAVINNLLNIENDI